MGKTELFTHFAERFGIKRTEAREFFDELQLLTEQELLRCGEFVLPGVAKLVVQQRERRMGRNPATRHPDRHDGPVEGARSTKAGASTPATRRCFWWTRFATRHRSTKAGASTPATPPVYGSAAALCSTAQRRPERQPRRHRRGRGEGDGIHPRSTKAGASTPATRER